MNLAEIHIASGPMGAGKTLWLIDQVSALPPSKQPLIVRYAPDTRYSDTHLATHNGILLPAHSAQNTAELISLAEQFPQSQHIFIDEMQFYDPTLVDFAKHLRHSGINFYASGLDLDFKSDPWPTSQLLIESADRHTQLYSTCAVCLSPTATHTQKLINGQPASRHSDLIQIAGLKEPASEIVYQPRCITHFQLID